MTTEAQDPTADSGVKTEGVVAEGVISTPEDARLTQAQFNAALQKRLGETEKGFEGRLAAAIADAKAVALAGAQAGVDALVEERLTAKLAEQALAASKAKVAVDYGLSEAQAARLTGDSPEAIVADAEQLFGAFRRPTPPKLNTGAGGQTPPLDLASMSPDDVARNFAALITGLRG